MQTAHLTDPALLASGTFYGVRLDPHTGNLAASGTPALVADVDPSAGTAYAIAAAPGGAFSGGWTAFGAANPYPRGAIGGAPLGLTTLGGGMPYQAGGAAYEQSTAAGDTWTLVTSAARVDVAWITVAAGGLAHATLDGQAIKGFDNSVGPGVWTCYPGGGTHTIVLKNTGDATLGAALVGTPADSGGTAGLAAALRLARNGQAVVGAAWTFSATSTTAISVLKNGTSVGTLAVGQSSDALVSGYTLTLVAGTWDATSRATVSTTAPTIILSGATFYTTLATNATYTSPVLDSGDPLAQWPLLEGRQGPVGTALPTVRFGVGQSSVPDGTWTWTALAPTVVADPDGNPWQRVVCAGPSARGRFAQFVGGLSNAVGSWVSDLRAFWWVPERDDFLRLFPAPTYGGQQTTRPLLAALAALFAYVDEQADSLLAGAAFTTASGSYLTGYGQQFATPRLPGEGDAAYRARVSTLFSGRQQGGSRPFLQATLSGALGCPVQVRRTPRSSSAFVLGAAVLGDQGLGQTSVGKWQWSVTIPFAGLQVAPETAATIVTQLRPVGSVATILYS